MITGWFLIILIGQIFKTFQEKQKLSHFKVCLFSIKYLNYGGPESPLYCVPTNTHD